MNKKLKVFTDEAQKVIDQAEEIARRWKHEQVGTEAFLVSLLSTYTAKPSRAERVLRDLGISPARVVFEICLLVQAGETPTDAGDVPHTPRVKKVIEYAIDEAKDHHLDQDVGVEYLLLGLLREQDGVAGQVLMNLNLRLEAIREQILCLDDEDRES